MLVWVAVFRLPLGVLMNWVRRPASAQPSRRANLGSVSGAKSSGWSISMSVRSAGWPLAERWSRCLAAALADRLVEVLFPRLRPGEAQAGGQVAGFL